MKQPRLWTLESGEYNYRVQFDFVDGSGKLLKTKTWQVNREKDDPPQVLFLQATAQIGTQKPEWKDVKTNFVKLTIPVETLVGDLKTTSFQGFIDENQVNQVLASAPLTMGVVVDGSGVHFTMHIARIKNS